jgi:hypothetical protein
MMAFVDTKVVIVSTRWIVDTSNEKPAAWLFPSQATFELSSSTAPASIQPPFNRVNQRTRFAKTF